MSKKLLFALIIGLSFLFLFKVEAVNADCFGDLKVCKYALGNPENKCCRSDSCSSKCAVPLKIWEYCYASQCCYNVKGSSCTWTPYGTFCNIKYFYTYEKCSTADTCKGDCYLYPGICSDSGCTVGGKYKICCKPDGSCCTCSGGKNTGTCPSSCPSAGPNKTTCPVQCSCSWVNKNCGQGGCGSGQRYQVYECNYSTCSGNGNTQCVNDSSCCS